MLWGWVVDGAWSKEDSIRPFVCCSVGLQAYFNSAGCRALRSIMMLVWVVAYTVTTWPWWTASCNPHHFLPSVCFLLPPYHSASYVLAWHTFNLTDPDDITSVICCPNIIRWEEFGTVKSRTSAGNHVLTCGVIGGVRGPERRIRVGCPRSSSRLQHPEVPVCGAG